MSVRQSRAETTASTSVAAATTATGATTTAPCRHLLRTAARIHTEHCTTNLWTGDTSAPPIYKDSVQRRTQLFCRGQCRWCPSVSTSWTRARADTNATAAVPQGLSPCTLGRKAGRGVICRSGTALRPRRTTRASGTRPGAGQSGAHTNAGLVRRRNKTSASNRNHKNYVMDAHHKEVYRDPDIYWEEDNKDFAVWGYKDCNGYHKNSKDFSSARGYKDRSSYHKDIADRSTQDKERRWSRPDPLAYLHKEGRHGLPEPDHCNNYSASSLFGTPLTYAPPPRDRCHPGPLATSPHTHTGAATRTPRSVTGATAALHRHRMATLRTWRAKQYMLRRSRTWWITALEPGRHS